MSDEKNPDNRSGFDRRNVEKLTQGMGQSIHLRPPMSLTCDDLRDIKHALETGEGKERAIGLLDVAIALWC